MTKDKAIEAINKLPSEFELEDLIDRLMLIEKIEKGLRQSKEGKVMSHEEAKKRLKSWEVLIESVDGFSQDFMENREQPEHQNRETFD